MIDLQYVIDILANNTSYVIEKARQQQPDLQEILNLPVIYVGYSEIKNSNPESILSYDILNQHGENLTQTFDISICSTLEDLSIVWKTIYSTFMNENEDILADGISGIGSTSSFSYLQGAVMGLSNSKIWHLDRWAINFPTIPVIL